MCGPKEKKKNSGGFRSKIQGNKYKFDLFYLQIPVLLHFMIFFIGE